MDDLSRPDAFSVSQVNEYIKMLLEGNPNLKDIWVIGEISGAKVYASGHLYFSLKDRESVLSAVMFKGSLMRTDFVPEDGMKVLVHGKISAYVPRGQYQLIADRMIPDGAGALAVAFEQLKRKLEAEGLFDPARKRSLPTHPKRIGVITSASGAAVHDIIRVSKNRYPATEILLFPSLVQGSEAPAYLAGGIHYFNAVKDDPEQAVDVIIIGRGGGSVEDLWCFNDENLARTVAASDIPVISAVGHEVDFTICDFVADVRAATPSAAAEIATPDGEEMSRRLGIMATRLHTAMGHRLTRERTQLDRLAASPVLRAPEAVYTRRREEVIRLDDRMKRAMDNRLSRHRQDFRRLTAQLEALSPLNVLGRGYAMVQDDAGRVISSAQNMKVGDHAILRFADGRACVAVEQITLQEETSS